MRIRYADTYVVYENVEYRFISRHGDVVMLGSLEGTLLYKVQINKITGAYRTRNWLEYKGHRAVVEKWNESSFTVYVDPADVDIFKAVEVERGVFQANVPFNEIDAIWEERFKREGFEMPLNLPTVEYVNI